MIYGYARQIVGDIDCHIQKAVLRNAFCNRIFVESENCVESGLFPKLERLFGEVTSGDVLVVQNLKILANSAAELSTIATRLKAAGAGIRSMGDLWCDTTRFDGVLDALCDQPPMNRRQKCDAEKLVVGVS